MNLAPPLLRLAIVLALLTAVALAGCSIGGGDDGEKASTTATVKTTETAPKQAPVPKLVQRARAVNPKAKPGAKATTFTTGPVQVSAGSTLLLVVSPPSTAVGKRMTISIPDVKGAALSAVTMVDGERKQTHIMAKKGYIKILDVRYKCSLPPTTFCPVDARRTRTGGVRLETMARRSPVFVQILTGRPDEALKPVRLLPTSFPAPGSPIDATVTLRSLRKGGSPIPSPKASAAPGDPVQAIVRPAPGSPARGILRIVIARTSGLSIRIRAGGTAGRPSSTATLRGRKGAIRIVNATWGCRLPPATFCPVSNVRRTVEGVVLRVPTPRLPITLNLKIASA